MTALIELTPESVDAIQRRIERQRIAKIRAENRFAAEQYLTENKKRRNRSLVAMIVTCSIMSAGAYRLGNQWASGQGAQAGKIMIKSEMTHQQLKSLNIAQAKPEKHGK